MRNCISSGDKWRQSVKAILVDEAAYLHIKAAHLLHVFVGFCASNCLKSWLVILGNQAKVDIK